MPNSGTGAVQIPVINQTVDTPMLGRPRLPVSPFHAEPVQSDLGPALEGAGKELFGVFAAQQQHADAIDVAQRMNGFQQAFGQAKQDALESGQTAPNMITGLQSASAKLIDQYQNGTVDPNNPNPPSHGVAQKLALAMNQHIAEQMQSFPAEAAQRVSHDLDFKFQQQNASAAGMIGQNYTIGGTADAPTFQLNADGMQAMQRQQATIDAAYPPDSRPTENQFYRNDLAQKSALQTGMAVAQDHPSLVDAFIKQHASMIPPEQQLQLTNRATQAIDLPMRQINASNQATRAQLLQKYTAQVQNGTLDTTQLEHDARFKLITPDDYERYAGIPLAQPSDPGAVSAATTAIQDAKNPDDLDALRAAIAGNPNIRGKDSVALPIQIENAKRQMNTTAGKAKISATETVTSAYDASGLDGLIADKINPGARLNARRAAIADFKAATLNETDPAKINEAAKRAIASHPGPEVPKRDSAAIPPAMTSDEATRFANWAKTHGAK